MIGLEYILNLYNTTQQELADELGIKKQNISQWFKGDRKIPKKYLGYLSEKFKIPIEYFNKELKKSDELKIKKIKLKNENPPQKVIRVYDTKEWGRYEFEEEAYNEVIEKEINLLNINIQRQELVERVYEIINFTKKTDDIKEYVKENKKIFGVFNYLISILESQKVEPYFLMEIFDAVMIKHGIKKDMDAREFVRHLELIFNCYEFDKNLKYSVHKRFEKETKNNDHEDKINENINDQDLRKVFITANGIINFNCNGMLANINDVEEFTKKTGKIIKGILILEDGKFAHKGCDYNNGENHKYKLISQEKPKLYTKFLNDIDRDIEEVMSCNFDEDDNMLVTITRTRNKEWLYIYNYSFRGGKIESNYTMIPSGMLQPFLD